VEPKSRSAFEHVRVRYFAPLFLFPFMPGIAPLLAHIAATWPPYWAEVAFSWLFQAWLAVMLVLLGVVAWRLPVRACVGRLPTRSEVVGGIQLTAFVFVASIAALYATFYPLSWLAPDFVQRWLIEAPGMIYFDGDGYPFLANLLSVISVCVLAPLLEETLFRGIILPRWTLRWGPVSGVLGSSALFGILHLDPIGAFVFGIAMCLLYLRSQSLALPVLCHAVNNFVSWLWEAVYLAIQGPEHVYTLEEFRGEWLTALVCAAIALFWVRRYARRPKSDIRWRLPVA
jgi:CAAX protease family protein